MAGLGVVGQGKAGGARFGVAWRGKAGKAWRGQAWQSRARQGFHPLYQHRYKDYTEKATK